MSAERAAVDIAVLTAGTLRSYVPVERAVAFARAFADHRTTALVLPDLPANAELRAELGGAALHLVRSGRLEPLAKFLWLVRRRPRIIYCVGGWARNVLPAFAARLLVGGTLVVDFDEVLSRWPGRRAAIFGWLERRLLPKADVLVGVSVAMQRWAEGLGIAAERVLRVPYAAHTRRIAASVAEAGASSGAEAGPIRVAYLGVLLGHYDFWFLLDVLAAARADGLDVVLELVGDGPGREEFLRRAEARGLAPYLRLHGYLDAPTAAPMLAGCDVLLFPIRDTENNRMRCPMKSYVYLAIGTPVVTCAVGEVQLAQEGWSQFVDFDDVPGWVAAIRRARSEPASRRAERRAHAVRHHDWTARAAEAWDQLVRALPELRP